MFSYKAKDKSGNIVTGSIESDDISSAVSDLRLKGLFVIDIQPIAEQVHQENPISGFLNSISKPLFYGVSIDEIAAYYRQFAVMIKSGMTVLQSLQSLANFGSNSTLKHISTQSANEIMSGSTFSDTLTKYPWVFKPMHLHLIRAGEISGNLDEMLERIAENAESERRTKQRIKMATLYPKILVAGAILIPQIPTLILKGFGDFIRNLSGLMLLFIFILVIWIIHKFLMQFKSYSYVFDFIQLYIPYYGKILRSIALSRFYRSFAILYAAGISPIMAVGYAASTTGNKYYENKINSAVPLLKEGKSIPESFAKTEVFPSTAIDMMNVGMRTGNIDQTLEKMADYTESEANVAINKLIIVLPIILFLIIAIYIGFFVISTYSGMYNKILTTE